MSVGDQMPDGEWPIPKTTRPWNCRRDDPACTRTVPCNACRNARNRRKGKAAQGKNRRVLETVSGTQASWRGKLANEETADHLPVRYENKAGAKDGANKVWTAFKNAEVQSEASRAIGDSRPFVATFSPDGVGDGLFVCRISKLQDVVSALVNGWD